jgi:hypothetical protein
VSKPSDLPRRLGDVLASSLGKLGASDEARAYAAWARAVGEPVSRGTRPKAFRQGQLTVECASSVWANELTYLGPQILRRMDEVAPGHPVQRFRFVIGRLPASRSARAVQAPPSGATQGTNASPTRDVATASREGARQESEGWAAKEKRRDRPPAQDADERARAQVEGVDDERLRAAIQAALRRSSQGPSGAPGRCTPSG